MSGLVIIGGDQLLAHANQELGVSDWHTIDQEAVNAFADLTDDHNWIHVDVERATRELGAPIVHGYFTLALGPKLWKQVVAFEGFVRGLNYGLDKVRFVAPMPVGGRVRVRVRLAEVTQPSPGTYQFTLQNTFEAEGVERPVCVSASVLRLIESSGPDA